MNRRDVVKLLAFLPGCSFIRKVKDTAMDKPYDVIIIGGGPAGLSAALTLARARRNILIIDDENPRNKLASHMQNFPSHDGLPPSEFKKKVLEDLKAYPNVHFEKGRAENLISEKSFRVTANGEDFFGRKIMLAHGMKDSMLPLPGFKELWAKSIFQCPYCHGYEIRESPIALIGGGMIANHMLPILKGLTDDLVLFTNAEELEGQQQIETNGIKIYKDKIIGLNSENGTLKSVELANGQSVERKYIFLKTPQSLSTNLATKIGCSVNEMGFYIVDEMGKTTVNGIFAAGDIVTMRQSVLAACAGGQMAGAAINYELLNEDFLDMHHSHR